MTALTPCPVPTVPSAGPLLKPQALARPGQPVIRLMDGQWSLWDAADACLEELCDKMQAHDPSSSSWTSLT